MALRPIAAVLALVLALALGSVGAEAAYRDPDRLIFSICTPSTVCQVQLAKTQDLGLDGVIASSGAPLDDLTAYADAAQSRGLKIWWFISDPAWWRSDGLPASYPYFQAACGSGCQTKDELRSFIVNWLKALPATGGYYVADDTGIRDGEQAVVAAHSAAVKAADPDHGTMIGTMGYADFGGGRVASWLPVADAIGQELYPIYTADRASPPGWPTIPDFGAWTAEIAAGNQATADRLGQPSLAWILQAFSWGWHPYDARSQRLCLDSDSDLECQRRYQYPTAAEQAAMLDGVLYYSRPRLIAWWLLEDTVGWPPGTAWTGIMEPTAEEIQTRSAGLKAALARPRPLAEAHLSQTTSGDEVRVDGGTSRGLGGLVAFSWTVNGSAQSETGSLLTLQTSTLERQVSLTVRDAAGQENRTSLTVPAVKPILAAPPALALKASPLKKVKRRAKVKLTVTVTNSGGSHAEAAKTCVTLGKGFTVRPSRALTVSRGRACWTPERLDAGKSLSRVLPLRAPKRRGTVTFSLKAEAGNATTATLRFKTKVS